MPRRKDFDSRNLYAFLVDNADIADAGLDTMVLREVCVPPTSAVTPRFSPICTHTCLVHVLTEHARHRILGGRGNCFLQFSCLACQFCFLLPIIHAPLPDIHAVSTRPIESDILRACGRP